LAGTAKEAKMTRVLSLMTAAFVAFGSVAQAQVPLAQESHINDSLRAARIGDVIRKTCPTISARMFVVLGKYNELKSYAASKGYSREDVDDFRKDPVQKKRLYGEADAYLKKQGAVVGQPETFCTVGEAEIARKSLVGQMIRSTK
jgi:hypothetical protein